MCVFVCMWGGGRVAAVVPLLLLLLLGLRVRCRRSFVGMMCVAQEPCRAAGVDGANLLRADERYLRDVVGLRNPRVIRKILMMINMLKELNGE